MDARCTVLIAAPNALPTLTQRAASDGTEVLAFTDAEAVHALEVITKRRPSVITLERLFAATPRGAALINRIKADPGLIDSEIRVVSHDSDYVRVSPRHPAHTGGTAEAPVVPAPASEPASPLDQRGTRRAARFRIAPPIEVVVDGNQATLVDLSTVGAQVVSAVVLKPNQRVRISLNDDSGVVRFNGAVAWASFEISPAGGPRYRAGVAFLDADSPAVDAYCLRHKA